MTFKQRLLEGIKMYHNNDIIGDILDEVKLNLEDMDLNRVHDIMNHKVIFTRVGSTATLDIQESGDPEYAEVIFSMGF